MYATGRSGSTFFRFTNTNKYAYNNDMRLGVPTPIWMRRSGPAGALPWRDRLDNLTCTTKGARAEPAPRHEQRASWREKSLVLRDVKNEGDSHNVVENKGDG